MKGCAIQLAVAMISNATLDRNILSLLKIGWYVPQKIGLRTVYDLSQLAGAGQQEAASQIIAMFFKKNRRLLEQYLSACHPHQLLIAEAFRAHDRKFYSASVMLLLAATRGVCEANLVTIESIVSRSNHSMSAEINQILEHHPLPGGFFDFDFRSRYLAGNVSGIGEWDSMQAMGLLAFVTDFLTANRLP